MQLTSFIPVTVLNRINIQRIERKITSEYQMSARDLITLLKRIDYLNAMTAYIRDNVYTSIDVDPNMFGSGLVFINAKVTNHTSRFVLKLEVNCETSELREALRLVDQVARSFRNADKMLGSDFDVTGGGMELHCGNLRELRCLANRSQNYVQSFMKRGWYNG